MNIFSRYNLQLLSSLPLGFRIHRSSTYRAFVALLLLKPLPIQSISETDHSRAVLEQRQKATFHINETHQKDTVLLNNSQSCQS